MENVKDYYRNAAKCPYIKQSAEKCPFLTTQVAACPFLRDICAENKSESITDNKDSTDSENKEPVENEDNGNGDNGNEEHSDEPERLQPLSKGVDANGFMIPMVEEKEPTHDAIEYYTRGRRH